MIQFDEDKQNLKLDELRKKDQEEFVEAGARKQGMLYVNLSQSSIETDALRLIGESKARANNIAAYNLLNKNLSIATLSPTLSPLGDEIIKELEAHGYKITFALASSESLKKAFDTYKELSYASETKAGALDISNEEISDFAKKVHSIGDIKTIIEEVLAEKKSYKISKIVEVIIAGALSTEASDIHIEPEEGYVRLRYRLDGVLNNILDFDLETFNLLLSRIKLLSGLKLNTKSNAQDGRFSVKINEDDIEIRTSILPGAYSESIVLRVLNPKSIAVSMEELGIEPKLLALLEKEIAKPNGMVLTTGPTGSGKTTTLYAFLKKIHNPAIKIITIENPIEYHLPGIVQTQVNVEKEYTFLSGLRSALRQDPDVIMVGEILDEETAEIAVNSALTGHLVFSTLHTNNAAGSFPRLIDLGVNPKVITSAINISMAQRLVRKLCEFCKKEVGLQEAEKKTVDKILESIVDKKDIPESTKMWVSVGCEKCNGTGYKGRIGIYEAILTDEKIEKVVNENPSEREISDIAKNQGILNMKQDGVLKILKGITSFDELKRVIDIEEA